MPDPSVWVLDFPVKREANSHHNSLFHALMNLTQGANAQQLLVLAVLICTILPTLVTLAIYLMSSILWSTILVWIANALHQVVLCQPNLALAPNVWVAHLALSLRPPVSLLTLPKEQNETAQFTCRQSRRFAKFLKLSLASPCFNAGIRTNNLHRLYPLRLRQQGYVTPSATTVILRTDFRNVETLKARTLRLQRHAAMLRTPHRSAIVSPMTGQKGERNNKNKRLHPP